MSLKAFCKAPSLRLISKKTAKVDGFSGPALDNPIPGFSFLWAQSLISFRIKMIFIF
jgi:hypothetical protein